MINPQELSRKAKNARDRATRKRRQKEKEQADLVARQAELDKAKANVILLQVDSRCEAEAEQGRNHAIICSVGYNDYERPRDVNLSKIRWDCCETEWLTRHCKLVYEALQAANLNPTIDYWHDGVGVESGFNIVVHWE